MATLARELGGSGGAGYAGERLAWPLAIAVVAALSVAAGWTGFIASDDELYYGGALKWAAGEPFAGDSHWTTRFPLVLTLAAMIKLAGASPLALHLTALLWFAAFVASGILLARSIAGERGGWFAGLLLASMPLIALGGSIVNCDLPEATFLMLGAWLLIGETGRPGPRPRLGRCVLAGICFGLAILCRETAVLALSGLGLLFLAGRPLPRWALLAAGCGAAAVLLGEAAFQYLMTGDALHRYTLAFNHDSTLDRAANEEGNLLVHPAVDPLLVVLVNNEFALLFWLAIPALLALRRGGIDWRKFAPVAAMGAASFLAVALLAHKLVLNPRYFTPSAVAAAILAGGWLARLEWRRAAAVAAAAVALNLLMLMLQNNHPRWPSEALAIAAAEDPARTIASDRDTMVRAQQRLRWAGLANVSAGGDYLLVPERQARGRPVAARYEAPWRPAGAVAALFGVELERLKAGEDMVLVRLR
jgi:4-amino-4-deoxy-L-arabinose transferase-like glycosyltransferase